jgi:FdhE protein
VTSDAWLNRHSYLRPLARLTAHVDAAADRVETPAVPTPDWEEYADDFRAGVPLLSSSAVAVDLEPAGKMALLLIRRLSANGAPEGLPGDISSLDAELHELPDGPRRIADWLLGGEGLTPNDPGLLRFIGWIAMARYLAPVRDAFGLWRANRQWLRRYCPLCGSAPAMAQLIGVDSARVRLLVCGQCGSRWPYVRTACPFCEKDEQRLSVLSVEGEGGLRIDYCDSCKGYLKTYDGQADEGLLSDWSSLHLDVVAHDRGLKRMAASLYELEPLIET